MWFDGLQMTKLRAHRMQALVLAIGEMSSQWLHLLARVWRVVVASREDY